MGISFHRPWKHHKESDTSIHIRLLYQLALPQSLSKPPSHPKACLTWILSPIYTPNFYVWRSRWVKTGKKSRGQWDTRNTSFNKGKAGCGPSQVNHSDCWVSAVSSCSGFRQNLSVRKDWVGVPSTHPSPESFVSCGVSLLADIPKGCTNQHNYICLGPSPHFLNLNVSPDGSSTILHSLRTFKTYLTILGIKLSA